MIIKEFNIRHIYDEKFKKYNFDSSINYFYSKENTKGKTTFLRGLLFSLGFSIPNTKKIDFAKYEFKTIIIDSNGEKLTIVRKENVLTINNDSYSVEIDFNTIISRIFGVYNVELIHNLLGTIYVDQEKGWTLLNRGKIIGNNRFNIEAFLRGLNNVETIELQLKYKNLSNEIKKYRLVKDVVEYQELITTRHNEINKYTADEELETQIGYLENELKKIENQIQELKRIRQDNSRFIKYIDDLGLQVRLDNEIYTITKDNLLDFKDISSILNIQINDLIYKKENIFKKTTELKLLRKRDTIVDVETALDIFNKSISNISINQIQVEKIITDLEKTREEIKKEIDEKTKNSNMYISKINFYIQQYWNEFKIQSEYSDNMLFTKELKTISGAELYKMVITYKLSYIKVLQEKLNLTLPIFIDSPGGREVEKDTIECILNALLRDFDKNQIFICSILKFESIKLLPTQILEFDNLNAFDKQSLLDLL